MATSGTNKMARYNTIRTDTDFNNRRCMSPQQKNPKRLSAHTKTVSAEKNMEHHYLKAYDLSNWFMMTLMLLP